MVLHIADRFFQDGRGRRSRPGRAFALFSTPFVSYGDSEGLSSEANPSAIRGILSFMLLTPLEMLRVVLTTLSFAEPAFRCVRVLLCKFTHISAARLDKALVTVGFCQTRTRSFSWVERP